MTASRAKAPEAVLYCCGQLNALDRIKLLKNPSRSLVRGTDPPLAAPSMPTHLHQYDDSKRFSTISPAPSASEKTSEPLEMGFF